ncbi:hypothetical protein CEXT_537951 [Caerostris extrusa]|uniref:Uncharacterized protein n=1 Tax=Caerostris extrusa TaxID=172846 RepID=A0AAV4XLP8_CAEEX|nr:hypothetical protein CEXT_537951 [Caerostris extrusa]
MAQMRVWFLEVSLTGLKVVKDPKRQNGDTKEDVFYGTNGPHGLKSKLQKETSHVLTDHTTGNIQNNLLMYHYTIKLQLRISVLKNLGHPKISISIVEDRETQLSVAPFLLCMRGSNSSAIQRSVLMTSAGLIIGPCR